MTRQGCLPSRLWGGRRAPGPLGGLGTWPGDGFSVALCCYLHPRPPPLDGVSESRMCPWSHVYFEKPTESRNLCRNSIVCLRFFCSCASPFRPDPQGSQSGRLALGPDPAWPPAGPAPPWPFSPRPLPSPPPLHAVFPPSVLLPGLPPSPCGQLLPKPWSSLWRTCCLCPAPGTQRDLEALSLLTSSTAADAVAAGPAANWAIGAHSPRG